MVEWISIETSLQFAGFLFILWFGQRFIDALFQFVVSEKVFSPIYKRILRKVKIFRTKSRPIAATFELSFTPEKDVTISSAIDQLDSAFQTAEQASDGRVSIESSYWDESDNEGRVDIRYADQTEQFTIDVKVVPDTQSIREHPSEDPTEVTVGSIGMEIDFKFPFDLLEETLFNLGSLINYIEDGFDNYFRGDFSDGRFVICPVESDLTMDEWIEEEQFDISLLLASKDNTQNQVEFFKDRAVVNSSGREIDAQTVKYVRELLLNYYL